MNNVVLTGRIANDLKIKMVGDNDTAMLRFVLAVGRTGIKKGDKGAYFIDCIAWGRLAENLFSYQGKGNLISISGEIQTSLYESGGVTKKAVVICARSIEFYEKDRKKNDKNVDSAQTDSDSLETAAESDFMNSDEDIAGFMDYDSIQF